VTVSCGGQSAGDRHGAGVLCCRAGARNHRGFPSGMRAMQKQQSDRSGACQGCAGSTFLIVGAV